MNSFSPKITVVTPSFNQGNFIEDTILSVLGQNYSNLEYIVIDGGSTDNTVDVIKKYENRITYWVSEKDNGLYSAIQKGFNKFTGEIMAWLNSDDMYHSKSLFTVAEISSSFNSVNWLQGNPAIFDEHGRTIDCSTLRPWSKYDYYLYNYQWIQQESTFWRRDLWIKVGNNINDSLKYAGDSDLWLRFFRHDKLYVTSALIGGFRQRSKSQLSFEFLDEYLQEANYKIKCESISRRDARIVFTVVRNL